MARFSLLHPDSLSRTVDAIQEADFERRPIPATAARAAARWIAARQGLPGAYGGTFAGVDAECRDGVILFTGERATFASARHILGEETCRALRLLRVEAPAVQAALTRADAGVLQCLERQARDPRSGNPGLYCCGKCTVGLWRNLLSGGLDRQEERLARGVRHLRTVRDGAGGWHRYPFWYTVLALQEMGFRGALEELGYARPGIERAASRSASGLYAARRHTLAGRTLSRIA